jgi:ribonucleoside-diphosphate reductase alpha chain
MPEAATADEIEKVYLEGWKLGLKAIAIYRDNSKRSQPLSTGKKKGDAAADAEESVDSAELAKLRKELAKAQAEAGKPHRRRLPAERTAVTHKFDIAGHEGYITVGLYPDGAPGEIFLKMAKEGSTVSGLMDSFATTVSVALQYGVPLRDLVNKFAHVRFEPSGFTGNQEIPIAKSIVDYIFRWLGSRFLGPDDKASLGLIDRSAMVSDAPSGGLSFGGASALSGSAEAISSAPATLKPSTDADVKEEPRASVAVEAPAQGAEATTEPAQRVEQTADAARVKASSSPAPSSDLNVIATNGQANGHANGTNGNGKPGSVTLSLGTTNVAFKIQEDAPSCAECGSIMVRNGSCYKCLNCGSTSGCS